MKVIKDHSKKYRSVVLRIREDIMKKVDEVAEENELSRQKLVAAILEQALNDKSFVLRLEE